MVGNQVQETITSLQIEPILWDGISLWKIPFHIIGSAKRRHLRIKRGENNSSTINIQISEKSGKSRIEKAFRPLSLELLGEKSKPRQIKFEDIIGIRKDSFSDAFNAFRSRNGPSSLPSKSLCFSITTANRTFDLFAESPSDNKIMLEEILNLMSSLSTSTRMRQPARRHVEVDTLKKKQFFAAAKSGNSAKFIWYLQQGYNVDTEEGDGRRDTALIAACRLGRTDIVQIALEFDAKNDPHPLFGQTALQVAVSFGHTECVQMILETAALSDADHIIANHEDNAKEAPLHVASRCGNIRILELLVKHGANICAVDSKGRTCLHCAVQSAHNACLRFLLHVGGNQIIEERDIRGLNCLHIATKQQFLSCTDILLQNGADVMATTPDGTNVLEFAKSQKARKMIDLILQYYHPYQSGGHCNNGATDLFQGLEIFRGTGISPMNSNDIRMRRSDDSQSLSPLTYQTEQIEYTQYEQIEYTQYQSDSQAESFYHDEHLWFTFFHNEDGCIHPYFLRAHDNHSQWEDPRHVGMTSYVLKPSYEGGGAPSGYPAVHASTDDYRHMNISHERNTERSAMYNVHDQMELHEVDGYEGSTTTNCVVTKRIDYECSEREEPRGKEVKELTTIHPKCPQPVPVIKERFNENSFGHDLRVLEHRNNEVDHHHISPIEKKSTGIIKEAGLHRMRLLGQKMELQSNLPTEYLNQNNAHMSIPLQVDTQDSQIESSAGQNLNFRDTVKIEDEKVATLTPHHPWKESNALRPIFPPKPESIKNSETQNNEDILNRFRKMLSLGVPLAAVLNKMEREETNEEIIRLLKNDAEGDESSSKIPSSIQKGLILGMKADLSKYTRMLGAVPLESVIHQMYSDCISENEIAAFKEKNGKHVSLCEDQAGADNKSNHITNVDLQLKKYMTMVSVGVPLDAVAQRMKKDSCSIELIKRFNEVNGQNNTIGERDAPDPQVILKDAKALVDNDNSLSKYKKMMMVGVPVQAIVNKMRQDMLDESKISAFSLVNGGSETSTTRICTIQNPALSLPLPPPQQPTRRTSVAMQKIHWKPVSKERVENSLWASATESENAIDDAEVKELENLFGAKSSKPQVRGRAHAENAATHRSKQQCVSLIDTKRSYNITISLAQFKAFKNFDKLCEAVISMDSTELNGEQLQNMMALLPTQSETKKMKEYKGDIDGLGRAELFFLSISNTPRFNQKLNSFIFVLQFIDNANALLGTLEKLENACTDIANNCKLAGVLKRLLAIGNLVNEGAGKPKAAGITMDSLLKTANKTGTDGKTRVIDVVVANFLKQDEEGNSIAFWTELKSVNDAARIDMRSCQNSLLEIQNGMKSFKLSFDTEKNLTASGISNPSSNLFLQRCKIFLADSNKIYSNLKVKSKDTEQSFETLCMFFAEDPKTCKATSIFEVILNFSRIVQMSSETWRRKARAAKRRATMHSTPIKTSRSMPLKDVSSRVREKPQSPKPLHLSGISLPAKNCREEIIKSIQSNMTPRRQPALDSDNDDEWE